MISPMAESEEELKSLLMRAKADSEKAGLKLNIQKTDIMASGPITSWQIEGETMKTVTNLFSWSLKSLGMMTSAMKLKDTCSLEESENENEVAQSCPTLCDPVDCSPPGSSIHGILQARILEWVAIFFSRGSSQPRYRTQVSHIAGRYTD